VNVVETPDEKEERIKDISFSMNTVSSGKATYVTPKINGELEGILILSDKQIAVNIFLGDTDILVFAINSIQGQNYIPVRLGVVDCEGVNFRDAPTKWILNDSLRVEIKGQLNAEVSFKLRYC